MATIYLSTAYVPFLFRGSSNVEDPLSGYVQLPATEYVALVEDPHESARLRLELIRRATSSIEISYHTFSEGVYSSMFVSEILKAADRGVRVDFINDGIIGGLAFQSRGVAKVLNSHENINIYFYEPFSLVPYSWNNRLHDKYLLVDGVYLLTGGRNISDKTFMPDGFEKKVVYDRDILIIGEKGKGVLGELESYIEALLSSRYSHPMKERRKYGEEIERLIEEGEEVQRLHPELSGPIGQLAFFETESIDLIANPIGRGSKKSIIWNELLAMFEDEEDLIILQSPYVVLYPFQLEQFESLEAELEILTNSTKSTPNIPAYPHYLAKRYMLEDFSTIYEYAGEGSVHTKSFIIGDDISVIGSFNLDPRSLYLDTETVYVIRSREFNSHLRSVMEQWKELSNVRGVEGSEKREEGRVLVAFKYAFLRLLSIILFPLYILV